ncbi:MAG: putative acetyltransferase [Candidatus Azotimanducaceae bacterium]|jgi:predicted acetyltransferase
MNEIVKISEERFIARDWNDHEAASVIISYTFSLGAKTVLASCDINNTASALAMRKCGISLLKNKD